MHYCLEIPEIVDMIFFHLDPRSSELPLPATPLRDLAVAARTCTIFQSPALDYLWSHVSLGMLLTQCMPSDLWAVDVTVLDMWRTDRKVRALRTIQTADWDRLYFYARRVKHLFSRHFADLDLSAIFPMLSVSLPHELFPKLQALDWQYSAGNCYYVHLFLHPRLTRIYFHLSSVSSMSLLSTLTSKCPRLVDVSISGPLSDLVPRVQNPKTLVDHDVFEPLSNSTTLKSLSLHGLPPVSALRAHGGRLTFPALHLLSLAFIGIGAATQFLQLCNAAPLVTFTMEIFEIVKAEEIHQLFGGIAAGFVHSSLTNLTVLTLVSIPSSFGFDFDDGILSELACAWPRIVSLDFTSHHHTHIPRATVRCLRPFAQHCPHLSALLLAFDATAVPNDEVTASPRTVRHGLKMLNVQQSPLTAPIAVARFISGLFPNLKHVKTCLEYDDNNEDNASNAVRNHDRWKEVEALLREDSAIREESASI
ncbi:hypothetical protein DFH06DRAFT_1340210 [Mycena polygramma]|nr:hypothetical protein DFH06DRAFT_1340210 [Mycena polygramma]